MRARPALTASVSCPWFIVSMRSAFAASERSWVIRRIAAPFLRARLNIRSITIAPVSWSRLPVGSSASISLRARDHGAGKADALLLAARKRARQMRHAVGQADFRRARRPPVRGSSLKLSPVSAISSASETFSSADHRGDEVEVLEQDAEVLAAEDRELILVGGRDVLARHHHLAGRRPFEPAQDHQQRGLAAARGPDDRRHLPAHHLERDVLEDVQHGFAAHQLEVGFIGFDNGNGAISGQTLVVGQRKTGLLRR